MTTQHDERARLIKGLRDLRDVDFDDLFVKAAALLAADAQAGGEAELHEKVKWGAQTYGPLLRAAIDLLASVDARHEETGTLKYTIPYGAVNALRDALTARPQPQAVAQGWIPVEQRMPKSGQPVLALQKWDHSGKLGVIRAAWIAAKTEESSPESDIGEYDEATDTYYDPEGWYEQISHWDEISAAGVSGATIVAWMPLPDVLSASPAAPVAAKHKPQAQAGEPLHDSVVPVWRHHKLERENVDLRLAIAKKDAEAAELRAALVGCEKDAGRYRFVRDANRSDVIAFELKHYAMETLDEYVDAAMEGECAAITQAQEVLK